MKDLIRKVLKENLKDVYGNQEDYYIITTNDEKYIVGYMYANQPRLSYAMGEFLVLVPSELVSDDILVNKFMYNIENAKRLENNLKYNTWTLWKLKDMEPFKKTVKYTPDSYEEFPNQESLDIKLVKYRQGYIRDNNLDVFD